MSAITTTTNNNTLATNQHHTATTPHQQQCRICFDDYPKARMRAAPCRHLFCEGCWRGYFSEAVACGPACLDLRCPLPDCKVAVSEPVSPPPFSAATATPCQPGSQPSTASLQRLGGGDGRLCWAPMNTAQELLFSGRFSQQQLMGGA